MKKTISTTCLLAILIVLAAVFNIPSVGFAQSQQANAVQPPQPKGGIATVVGVDQPDNCLRIRSGPGSQYDVIGCANLGDKLKITGVWTSNDWAQLENHGWVYGPQVSTDLRPPRVAYSTAPAYVVGEEVVPDYDDWGYLPSYGYDTYSYGDVPIFFYNVAVWRWCHPWWWWHGLQAWWWQNGFHGRRAWDAHSFRNFAHHRGVNFVSTRQATVSALHQRGRTARIGSITSSHVNRLNATRFNANHSNIKPSNVSRLNPNRSSVNRFNTNRFNANSFRSGTNNSFRSRSFSSPQRFPSRSVNTFHPGTFSTPHVSSGGGLAGRSFGGLRGSSGSHFGGHSFHAMGGGRRR